MSEAGAAPVGIAARPGRARQAANAFGIVATAQATQHTWFGSNRSMCTSSARRRPLQLHGGGRVAHLGVRVEHPRDILGLAGLV